MQANKRQTATPRITKVLLVDDHPLVRRGIRQLIEREAGFEVCGETDNAAEAIGMIREHKPDIAIVDITLADTSGVELVKDIHAMFEDTKVIVASMHDESLYAERAMRAGAMAYVNKEASTDQLLAAIRRVASGRIYVSPDTSDRLLRRVVSGNGAPQGDPVESLSDRELEVFQLIGQGLRTREIASRLCLSVKTIETYRENIKSKLNLQHGNELIQRAVHWHISRQGGPAEPTPGADPAAAPPA